MALPYDDDQRLQLIRSRLFSSVVGDVMDVMGLRHQFLPPEIRPLALDMALVGRAMPVLEADVYEGHIEGTPGPFSDRPFGLMLEALDSLRPKEVYLANRTARDYAEWGELMSTRARHLGAAGAVLEGFSRDTKGILALGFPVFSRGSYGCDQGVRGKVIDYRVPVEIGTVRIDPGDLLIGDADGVVAVPQARESEVIEAALQKVDGENAVSEAIRNGMSAVEAFRTHGVM
jgi:regulator of RNase E activity RraA